MAALIKKKNAHSDLTLAGLPLIKNKETSHLLFHGTVESEPGKRLLDKLFKVLS
jgi:hypothetical protein